jgi:hypothetical protein
MKSNQLLKGALMLTAGLMLSTAASHAALYYQVSINTSSLTSLPASSSGPFSLYFQFNAGGTPGNNTAVVNNFNFNGGSVSGAATSLGSVTGDLSSTITFNDTSYSELFQGFNPGTMIQFDVAFTGNADSVTPDSFVVAILDNGLLNIPTTSPSDSLAQIDINPTATVNTGTGTGAFSGVVATVTAVPEPSAALLGAVACGVGVLRRRRA